MPQPGLTGIVLGGVKRNTLYVGAASVIVNAFTGQVVTQITNGTGLYAITGLDSIGAKSTELYINLKINETC